jgi:nicotinamidase-related amidase
MANALLVIDVQHYFLQEAPGDLPKRIVKHYRTLQYDYIIFTTFRNYPDSNFVKLLKWDMCSADEDVELPKEFQELATAENTFERAAYSAFEDTKLHEYLKEHQVERLVLCGVDLDACVLATGFAAFDLGYHVKVNFDLTYSSNELSKAAQLIAGRNIISRD